jgi:CO/xanthine dehydrogenase Mo-binding subunit
MTITETELTKEYKYIGKPIPRVDNVKAYGRAVYGYDIEVPNMIYGAVKRSIYPHAMIKSIDTSRAEELSGVISVVTSDDLPDSLYGVMLKDTPVLARERVRYYGEPVAAVAAVDLKTARKATELIEIEYEPLKAVFDPEEALASDAPILHPRLHQYRVGPPFKIRTDVHPNICNHYHVEVGDVETYFSRDEFIIVENRFTTQAVQHFHLEPSSSVAKYEPNSGQLTIWTATQSPYMVRQQVSEALQIPLGKIRVLSVYPGAGFGSRLEVQTEAIAAALSIKSKGLPVKLTFSREEVFYTSMRHPFTVYIRDAVRRDGRIVARDMRVILNGGAYSGGFGISVARNCIFGAVGTYNIQNFRFDSIRVYTNLPPAGAYRGYGSMQVEWAIESQMDIIAERLGIDPISVRLANIIHEGEVNAIGERVRRINHEGVLNSVLSRLRRNGENLPPEVEGDEWVYGWGIALTTKYTTAPTASAALIRVLVDGTVLLYTSAVEIGTASDTIFAQIVAEELGCPIENIVLVSPDTYITPFDDGANSSRRTYYLGNAIIMACNEIKQQIFRLAAERLNASIDNLELDNWRITDRTSGRSVSLEELFIKDQTRSGAFFPEKGELIGRGVWHEKVGKLDPVTGRSETDRVVTYYTPVATGVELMVNKETGQIRILNIYCAVDVGCAINPLSVAGQIAGGVAQGLGTTLFEEMKFIDGVLINPDLAGYKVPSILDVPRIEPIILEKVKEPNGPYGARGVGEGPITGVAPAIANAIANAVGIRVYDLPITPEKIYTSLKNKSGVITR